MRVRRNASRRAHPYPRIKLLSTKPWPFGAEWLLEVASAQLPSPLVCSYADDVVDASRYAFVSIG